MPVPIEGQGTAETTWMQWGEWEQFPALTPAGLVPAGTRAVIVAPHPDDEILGCGGMLAALCALGRDAVLIAVTDGAASHPGSTYWDPARLADTRPQETAAALATLGAARCEVVRLGIADGEISAHQVRIAARIRALLLPGDVVFTTWRGDGHPDHEGTGHACALAVQGFPARLVEYPVWAWHWSAPGDSRLPWQRVCRIRLARREVDLKGQALDAFCSQTEPDPATGAPPVLPRHVLNRFLRPFETVLL